MMQMTSRVFGRIFGARTFRTRTIAALLVLTMVVGHPSDAADQPSRAVAERFGLTPAQTRQLNARYDGLSSDVINLSAANKLQARTLGAIALELGSRNPKLSRQQFIELIRARAGDANKAQEKIDALGQTLSSLDPGGERTRALKLLDTARTAFDEGRLKEAEEAFASLAFLRSSELGQARKAWIEAIDLQAQSAFVRGDMEAMDRILSGRAAALAAQMQGVLRDQWLTELQRAYYWSDYGRRLGNNDAVQRSIGIYREAALPLAPRNRAPLDWATTQAALATALLEIGQRETGTQRIEQAADAHRFALEEFKRDQFPLDWARSQVGLASALFILGERENGIVWLELAASTYRLALEEQRRDTVPQEWARTQQGLGNALLRIGSRGNGTAVLEQAADAYRLALEELKREQLPFDWASVQMSLGSVLYVLGERENGTVRLEQSVAAYKLALEERRRELFPLYWAKAQAGLASVLSTIGHKENSIPKLELSATAYRLALEEQKRDRAPLEWASATMGLANTLLSIGQRETTSTRITEAISLYRLALEEQTRDKLPLDWARTMLSLCRAEMSLAQRNGDTAAFQSIKAKVQEAKAAAIAGGDASLARYADGFLAEFVV